MSRSPLPRPSLARLRAAAPLALLLAMPHAWAQAPSSEIWVCIDDSGRKTYQNTGNAKGCKRMDNQPITTIPAPRQRAVQPAVEQRVSTSPGDFPRVERDAQRARDSDRRRILEDELRLEEERLARLKSEYNGGEPERRGDERNFARYQERVQRLQDDIARSEANLVSLRRELGQTRMQ